MSGKHPYSRIYSTQRLVILLFYFVAMIALSIPLARLILFLFPDQLYPLFISLILYMAILVVGASVISTLSYIPFNLASAFDPIKNDIASGKITGIEELGKRLTEFTTSFFDFAFLDIDHAFLYSETAGMLSHEKLTGMSGLPDERKLVEQSRDGEILFRAAKIRLEGNRYHLYILPIFFGDRWLGYMGLLSRRRIGKFFRRFLQEFENNFVDDQLLHIISNQR